MGLVEICLFVRHSLKVGYTFQVLACGFGASWGQIAGTCLMIYASTKGLAGPASAMI